MVGQTISHYRVLDKLGEGGMGVVYQARDMILDRVVALKFLAPHLVSNSEVRKRFIREAKTAAALQHPNICTVHEIGEAGGHTFIAMACLDGRELADEIAEGCMQPDRALALVIQFAEGLAEAHSKGIVHRDIKPANLFVTSTSRGVILDFGLAQLASPDSKLTREGSTLGTCAYMSPEQATGADVDARTDVWALGCVLYEMLAGHPPFHGHYDQAIVYSILNEQPKPLGVDLPGIEEVVTTSLSKRPQDRYANAGQLLGALTKLDTAGKRPSAASADPASAQVESIAVLPFENRSRDEDDEYFSDGISEDIISALAKIDGLRVTPRASAFYFKGRQAAIDEIAAKLNVGAILTGTVRRAGQRLRITAELIRIQDQAQMWSERYDRILEDVFDIQDEISAAIAGALRTKLTQTPHTQPVRRRTPAIEAYRVYLQGRQELYRLTDSSLRRAVGAFEQALGTDPEYTDARAALSMAKAVPSIVGLQRPGEEVESARAEALRAIGIDETNAVAHNALGMIQLWHDRDWAAAEISYRRAIDLDPSDAVVYSQLAELLAMAGRESEGLETARIGQRIDPLNAFSNRMVGLAMTYTRDFEGAIEQSERTLDLAPGYVPSMWDISYSYCGLGRPGEGIGFWAKMPPDARKHPFSLTSLGLCHALAGENDQTRKILARLEELRQRRYCPWIYLAWLHLYLGDLDRAFELSDKALDEREAFVLVTKHHPVIAISESFVADPRYEHLVSRIGYPD